MFKADKFFLMKEIYYRKAKRVEVVKVSHCLANFLIAFV